MFRELDSVLNRTLEFAKFELLFGRAELIADLPGRFAAVTEQDVQAAAARLRPDSRAVVELVAGGATQ
jgi:predicted Zn-dependent peptidase